MTEIKKYCDRCGVKLNGMIDYCGIVVVINHVAIEMDLCRDHFEELCGIVRKFAKRDGKRIVKVCEEAKGGNE